ncbi:O-antigen ligase family protein [Thermodesulfobacteriota bacterium]
MNNFKRLTHGRVKTNNIIYFIFFSLVFYPLAIYRIPVLPGIHISIDRFSVALALLYGLATFLLSAKQRSFSASFQLVLWGNLFAGILGIFSLDPQVPSTAVWGKLPVFLMNMTLLLLVFELCHNNEKNIRFILFSYVITGTFYVFFSSYSFWHFFSTGFPPTDIPFREYLPFDIPTVGHFTEKQGFITGNFMRLALPFSRPQDLGLASAITAFFLVGLTALLKTKMKIFTYVLIFFLVLTVFFAGSRSAIFPAIAGIIIFWILSEQSHGNSVRNVVVFFSQIFFLLIISFLLYIFVSGNEEHLIITISRLFSAVSSTEAHLNIRQKTFEEFVGLPLFQMLIGNGLGSFPYLFGGVSSGHMTYGTVLIELGVFGLLAFVILFIYIGFNCLKINLRKISLMYRPIVISSISIFFILLLANLFYQFYYSTFQWVALGLIAAIIKSKKIYTISSGY